jgi:hypothetical protein
MHTLDGEQVLGVQFANPKGTKAAFFTESSIGFYNLETQSISSKQKLGNLPIQTQVVDMAVNPELCTIVVFVKAMAQERSVGSVPQVQNLIILWRTGQLQEEESLKMSVASDLLNEAPMPPAICVSTWKGPLVVVSRTFDGRVLCWRLNDAGSQLTSEARLVKNGGLLALSGNGRWIAVSVCSAHDSEAIQVFTLEGVPNSAEPRPLPLVDRRPASMAIIENGSSEGSVAGCLLAIQPAESQQGALSIEVLSVEADGAVSVLYRLLQDHQCRCAALRFCHQAPDILFSRWPDGTVKVINLKTQQARVANDDAGANSVGISCDQELLVTAIGNSFRFHRLPKAQAAVTLQ